jgi:hypothetical protein
MCAGPKCIFVPSGAYPWPTALEHRDRHKDNKNNIRSTDPSISIGSTDINITTILNRSESNNSNTIRSNFADLITMSIPILCIIRNTVECVRWTVNGDHGVKNKILIYQQTFKTFCVSLEIVSVTLFCIFRKIIFIFNQLWYTKHERVFGTQSF